MLTHSFLTAKQLLPGFTKFLRLDMIPMPNSHLVLHKETLKQQFENKISIKHLIKIINLVAKNCPVGRNGLTFVSRYICSPLPIGLISLLMVIAHHWGTHKPTIPLKCDGFLFSATTPLIIVKIVNYHCIIVNLMLSRLYEINENNGEWTICVWSHLSTYGAATVTFRLGKYTESTVLNKKVNQLERISLSSQKSTSGCLMPWLFGQAHLLTT